MASPALLEPGIFGIFRPVLLLPEGIADRLTPAQLKSILAHELCHVKRRDNLAASIHMIVEATFWFHPLVWWIGARLVEERERACDEEVLRSGSEPGVYAESILQVCKFYLESPLKCVAGVTGSDLKKRIESIMLGLPGRNLSRTRKLLLVAASIGAIVGPVIFGVLAAPHIRAAQQSTTEQPSPMGPTPKWEVVSVRPCDSSAPQGRSGGGAGGGFSPGTLTANCAVPMRLIEEAYGFFANGRTPTWKSVPIEGAPSWLNSERYTIAAKSESPQGRAMMFGPMMQTLLEDRFKLKIRREIREVPVYNLTIAKGGPRNLKESKPGTCVALDMDNPPPPSGDLCKMFGRRRIAEGEREFKELGVTMAEFSDALGAMTGRNVVDKTGLSGTFDIESQVSVPDEPPRDPSQPRTGPQDESDLVFAVVQKLGMKLESAKGPGVVYVIEHVERPSDNFEPPVAKQEGALHLPAAALDGSIRSHAVAPLVTVVAKPQSKPAIPAEKPLAFEVATIKPCGNGDAGGGARGGRGNGDGNGPSPDRLNLPCQPVMLLIRQAYLNFAGGRLNPRNTTPVDGGPAWINSDRYQITAKAEGTPGMEMMRGPMLQALLEDRFKLKIRRESREVPAYAMTVAKGGPKLKPFEEGSCVPFNGGPLPPPGPDGKLPMMCSMRSNRNRPNGSPSTWELHGESLDGFAKALGDDMDRIVVNKTGLAGKFDFHLEYTPDESTPLILNALRQRAEQNGEPVVAASDPAGGLSIFTAIQQQLGLKLDGSKGAREFLVIDRIERPTEN